VGTLSAAKAHVVCPAREAIDQIDRRAAAKQERLETELSGYKTNLIKESIRMGHNDLADFYYERGDLQVGNAQTSESRPSFDTRLLRR
jgi:26S proteasome subunit RPN7